MPGTIAIVGYGPGVSTAVAETFGAQGFSVAAIARDPARLAAGVEALQARGIPAGAFPADARDPVALGGTIGKARAELGPIAVVHWNAYGGRDLGDLLTVRPGSLHAAFDLAVVGLLSAVQEAYQDLKASGNGAVLVTNGAYGELDPLFDALAIASKAEGVALGNAAKAKLVGLLAARLKDEGIYVGEVTIAGIVASSGPAVPGVPMIEPKTVAETF